MAQDYELTKHVLREMHSLNERNEIVVAGAAMAIASIDVLLQQRAELLEAAKVALAEAESWISDQLEGTQSYKSAMAQLDPVRAAITNAEAAE